MHSVLENRGKPSSSLGNQEGLPLGDDATLSLTEEAGVAR